MSKYVPIEDVVYIHEMIIATTGGKGGVRDFVMLHGAVSRPQATFAGKDLYPGIHKKAAALMHSLLLNHAFEDGNKRTSIAVCERFLFVNGYAMVATSKQKVAFTLDIEAKTFDFDAITAWLKKHTKRISI